MTTLIEDNQLKEELVELCEISNKWLSDLDYFEHDLKTFQRLLGKAYYEGCLQKSSVLSELRIVVAEIESSRLRIMRSVKQHVDAVKLLVGNVNASISLGLLEHQIDLEGQLRDLYAFYNLVKKEVFNLTSSELQLTI